MTTFLVKNGINLGDERFEVDEEIEEEKLEELTTRKARRWLLSNGDIERIDPEEEEDETSPEEPAGEE